MRATLAAMDVLVLLTPHNPSGVLVDANAPHFSPRAQGISRGDGIFETMLFAGNRVKKMDEHLWRLRRSAAITDIEAPSDEHWRRAVETAVAAWRYEPGDGLIPHEALVKLLVLRGYAPENPDGDAWGLVTPMRAALRPTQPIKVALLDRGFTSRTAQSSPWLLLGAKTLSYATNMAAMREAHRRGAEDVIFTTTDGFVLEAPTASVFIKRGRTLITTPTELGVLPGTTQRVLFRAAEQEGWSTAVERLTPSDLHSADAVWLSSSGRLISQVRWLDDEEIAVDDAAHAELMQLLLSTR